ncbi:ellis-van Creveld syndrome protein isoform X2 [Sphaerodactylus townsendi]|uniref:ellis-van Creveld syndrome protein isoform X2 n=1 Tax=Sphaerodactylus townsendi TaxID=933632 RepID=UPI002026D78E|nr:ellis-van Creveld syndrome protein isoform X2 [Sphaerodactylus townsendi]
MVPAGGGGAPPSAGPCGAEVALRLGAAPGQASSGLLALAVLLGLGLGGGAAALLWLGALGPRLLLRRRRRRQKDDSQRLIESNNSAPQKHEDYFLPEMKEAETLTVTEKDDQPSWNTNLTEFALKAKVIYPINQRFRPLADGSSNPSLHDTAKQRAMLPHQTLGGSTSSSTGSLSQGAKDDCTSSTTIHSAASDDRYQDQTFLKVTCFPELLACDVFDVKMCLYSLFLKHLQLIDVELRRQKHVMILHVFRVYIVDFYFKKKMPEDLYQSILRTQETAFEELQAQLNSRLLSMEFSGAHKAEYQTLDDLERSDKGYADHVLDHMEAFWQQTDQSLLLLLDQAKCSRAKAKKIRMCLGEAMIAVEEFFRESQDSQVMATQERMFNWEQLVKTIALLKTQIQEESKCRFHAISHTLDELLRRNNLTVKQKEELLTGIQEAFAGKIELYEEECIQLGKNLIQKCLLSHTEKIECLSKAQEDQEGNLLHKSQPLGDLNAFLKAYCEMSEQQRKTRWKLEKESDCETIEAMIDLYKKLHSRYSHCLEDLVVQLFLQTLPVLTSLPLQECEFLKDEQQEDLALQLEKSESHREKLWVFFQEQMQQEQKLWMEEHAFSAVTHKCLSETNEKIVLCVMSRLGGLSKASLNYVTQKHKSLLQSMLRRLLLRQIALCVFAQMRTSRRRSSVGELKEHHILQQSSSHCFDELQWKQLKETELHIAEEEEKLGNEMQQTRLEFHQQLTAETQESLQFLQQHMQQVIGQALVQQARQLAEKHDTDGEEDLKVLKEATWENVHLSSHRAQRLLQNYLEQLTKIHKSHEDAAQKALQERTECHKHPKKWDCEQRDQPDPPNTSPASQTRTLWKLKRVQAWFDVQQKNRLAALKQKMLSLSTLEMQLENQLMERSCSQKDWVPNRRKERRRRRRRRRKRNTRPKTAFPKLARSQRPSARTLIAKRWKSEELPEISEWINKLIEYLGYDKLSTIMKQETIDKFIKDWELLLKNMDKWKNKIEILSLCKY